MGSIVYFSCFYYFLFLGSSRETIERVLGLKNLLESLLEKYNEMNITPMTDEEKIRVVKGDLLMSDEDESYEEESFLDVPESLTVEKGMFSFTSIPFYFYLSSC